MNKRTKITLLSITMGVILLLSPYFHIDNPSLFAVLLASGLYFGLYWVLEFSVVGLRLIFVFLLPIIFSFLFAQRLLALGGYESVNFFIALLFAILIYILILTANILNVASVKKIPLLQVAQTSLYFFSTITSFLITDAIQGLGLGTVLDIIIMFILFFVIFYQLLWFVIDSRTDLFKSVLIMDLLLVLFYFIFSFFPIPYLLLNIAVSVLFYIFSGLLMHSYKSGLTRNIIWEYLILILILSGVIAFTLDWGCF